MATHIVNDRGETLPAIGAENSMARSRAKWPKLLSELDESNFYEKLKCLEHWEAFNLLKASNLKEDAAYRFADLMGKRIKYTSDFTEEDRQELLWLDELIDLF